MEQKRTSIEYGGAGLRFIATLLDSLILLPASAIMLGIFSQTPFIGVLANLAIHMVYYVMFLNGSWRATPGKRVMKLYVVSTQGLGAISKEQAVFRFVVYHIPTLPLYTSFLQGQAAEAAMMILFGIWFIPILTTKEKTGLHDIVCNTRVMRGQL